jgi:hypothetical protein
MITANHITDIVCGQDHLIPGERADERVVHVREADKDSNTHAVVKVGQAEEKVKHQYH